MVWTFCLSYGLDSFLGTLYLERDTLSWLAIGFKVFFWNYSVCQGQRCSGVASCLWLGDNIAILSMEKQTHLFISDRLWAHTIFRQSNHWKIDWYP
jgi:hypothetical protein